MNPIFNPKSNPIFNPKFNPIFKPILNNSNYDLMGFDIIEINLVFIVVRKNFLFNELHVACMWTEFNLMFNFSNHPTQQK